MALDPIRPLLRCPRCGAALVAGVPLWRCVGATCRYRDEGFPSLQGTPVLIDFEDSIFDRASLEQTDGASPISRKRHLFRAIRERLADGNDAAAGNCAAFLTALRARPRPRVLVVGGGARGGGTQALYDARDIIRVTTDVYASPDVDLLADGHRLPFADASFDGVWIQAVLEHVVTPASVVAEIHRVLADDGLVYAETPFLQHVHERAYDFTRFTRNGHRWLFRRFAEVRSGTTGGPAQSLLWSIRYLARSLFRSDKVGSLFAVAFFWLKYLDRFVDERYRADAATGVFFLGRKTSKPIAARELVAYFPGVRGA